MTLRQLILFARQQATADSFVVSAAADQDLGWSRAEWRAVFAGLTEGHHHRTSTSHRDAAETVFTFLVPLDDGNTLWLRLLKRNGCLNILSAHDANDPG